MHVCMCHVYIMLWFAQAFEEFARAELSAWATALAWAPHSLLLATGEQPPPQTQNPNNKLRKIPPTLTMLISATMDRSVIVHAATLQV